MRKSKLLLFAICLAATFNQPGLTIVDMTEKDFQRERSLRFKSMPPPVPVPAEVLKKGKAMLAGMWRATIDHSPEIQLALKKLLPAERVPFYELPTTQYKVLFGKVACSIPERMAEKIAHEVFLDLEQKSELTKAAQTPMSDSEQEAFYRLLRITYEYVYVNELFYNTEFIRLHRAEEKLERLKSEINGSGNLDATKNFPTEQDLRKIQQYIKEHENEKAKHRLQLVDLAGEAAVNNLDNQLIDFSKMVPDYLCR